MIDFQDLRLRERLQELDLRTWLNENSAVAMIAAVVLLVIALGVMLATLTGGGGAAFDAPTEKYFYDLNTRELFVVPMEELPPIERGQPYVLPNGQAFPAGVEARVFRPQDGTADDQVVAWVETLLPARRAEWLAMREQVDTGDGESLYLMESVFSGAEEERMVMDPHAANPVFVPRYSEMGFEITGQVPQDAEGRAMRLAYPE